MTPRDDSDKLTPFNTIASAEELNQPQLSLAKVALAKGLHNTQWCLYDGASAKKLHKPQSLNDNSMARLSDII